MIIIPGQSGTYRHLRGRVTHLLAEPGLSKLRRYALTRPGAKPGPPKDQWLAIPRAQRS
jgi:hypothetical protein